MPPVPVGNTIQLPPEPVVAIAVNDSPGPLAVTAKDCETGGVVLPNCTTKLSAVGVTEIVAELVAAP